MIQVIVFWNSGIFSYSFKEEPRRLVSFFEEVYHFYRLECHMYGTLRICGAHSQLPIWKYFWICSVWSSYGLNEFGDWTKKATNKSLDTTSRQSFLFISPRVWCGNRGGGSKRHYRIVGVCDFQDMRMSVHVYCFRSLSVLVFARWSWRVACTCLLSYLRTESSKVFSTFCSLVEFPLC